MIKKGIILDYTFTLSHSKNLISDSNIPHLYKTRCCAENRIFPRNKKSSRQSPQTSRLRHRQVCQCRASSRGARAAPGRPRCFLASHTAIRTFEKNLKLPIFNVYYVNNYVSYTRKHLLFIIFIF